MNATYHFLPWARKGLATAISQEDTLDNNTNGSVNIEVYVEVNEQVQTQMVNLRLHHPGDVNGVNRLAIIRTDPAPWVRDFEPNFFPVIDFDLPDFPWLFMPAAADAQDRLRPWLVLVTVRQQDGVMISQPSDRSLPVLRIESPAQPSLELPDLAESWAWAHSQVVVGEETDPLESLLSADSPKNLSRLVSPRRLEPFQTYYACLVPAFEAGRKTGLGLALDPADEQALQPAWLSGGQAPSQIELPVYYHWEFSTGEAGDFESLVRKLEARPLPSEVGKRPVSVINQPFNLPDLAPLALEGALRPATVPTDPPDLPENFTDGLEEILNLSATAPGSDPLVTPPIYGSIHTALGTVPDEIAEPKWLRELNLHPLHRIAAGFGTLVIQDQQEELMAAAWEGLGEKDTQQIVQQMELAREVSNKIFRKHFKTLVSTDALFQMTAPVQSYFRPSEDLLNQVFSGNQSGESQATAAKTLRHHLQTSVLPKAIFSQSFLRIARQSGQLTGYFLQQQNTEPNQLILHFTQKPINLKIPSPGMVGTSILQEQLAAIPEEQSTDTPLGRLNLALPDLQAYFSEVTVQATRADQQMTAKKNFAPGGVELLQEGLLQELDPEVTMSKLVQSKLDVPEENTSSPPGSSPLVVPEFTEPMYKPLQDIDQNLLLPGIEHVLDNTVALLQTNPAFVAAYMLGLNHEMSRELLWREFPANLKGTYFTQFWDGTSPEGTSADCPPIHTWLPNQYLAQQCTSSNPEGQLVFLIRGELLRRFPNSILYAVPADPENNLGTSERYPVFQGHLDPDISFFGFDLTLEEVTAEPGWFFVLQQQPTEPRFGLDVERPAGPLSSWDDLTWEDVTADPAVTYLPLTSPLTGTNMQNIEWAYNASHMAMITRKKPLRIAIPASVILPTQNENS